MRKDCRSRERREERRIRGLRATSEEKIFEKRMAKDSIVVLEFVN